VDGNYSGFASEKMEMKIIDGLKGGTDARGVGAKADIAQVILEAAFGIARRAAGQGRQ
jgi:hypothetical protein